MEKSNYPNWLVPLDLARKLIGIGMSNSEVLVCNDGYYGWYRNEEMYDYDNDGELIIYTALDASKCENSNLEATYTWEQVFEWFRDRGFRISLENHEDSTKFMFYNMKINEGKHFKGEYYSYEEARKDLVNNLIEVYGNSIQSWNDSI